MVDARRMSIQPSEFMKPAFVVICAWLFAEHARQPEIPGNLFAILLFGMAAALLIAQPDLGQTILIGSVWGAMFFMAGMPWLWIVVLGALGSVGFVGAYYTLPHVAGRIDRFLTGEGDTFQVDTAREAIIRGDWFGQGPGEGMVKRIIPDSHTDFIFSVAAEEFGIVFCMVLVAIFAFLVLRGLSHAYRERNDFNRLAVSGLVLLLGIQSMINIGVNLELLPAKGMTLPLISYGGSSMTAICVTAGFILALTRRRRKSARRSAACSGRRPAFPRSKVLMTKGIVLLAAGGTGGHLFPAEALAHELKTRGYAVHLVTDRRAERYAGSFPADDIHTVSSATIGSKNPVAVIKAFLSLWRGYREARSLISRLKPKAVVGFGGYPTVPPLFAAAGLGVPTAVHEQNAVMGRANKLLASRVRAIAGGFLSPDGEHKAKMVLTGNPVRPAVIAAADQPYLPSTTGEPFHLVVFGGSQGAQFFSDAVPGAIRLLPDAERQRLVVTQQARPEDRQKVIDSYATLGIRADVAPFFTDMAERLAGAHLVICRSGASTVSELAVIGRPSILVPYPYALDHDQAANAAALAAQGGAQVIAQAELSAERIADLLSRAMEGPDRLARMAAAAKSTGKPDAAGLLADLVEAIAAGKGIAQSKGATQ